MKRSVRIRRRNSMGLFNKDKGKKKETKEANRRLDLLKPEVVREYVADQLAELCQGNAVRTEHGVVFPKWNVSVNPGVQQVTEKGIVLDLFICAPQWGKDLYECTVGMGSDPKTNIGIALGSFVFAFMQGITAMEEREGGISLETIFAGKTHKWQVYRTDIVGMGKEQAETDCGRYWDLLKDDIIKRLGNQKLCYVKIFGSKMGDNVTGECRIDDIASKELSEKVAQVVSKWDVEGFVSQKQFFFIRQEEATTLPYPYEGREGYQALKEKVALAAKMFHASNTEELYNTLSARMGEAFGDFTLGQECFAFLPEMCTENAMPEAPFPENLLFIYPDGRREKVYKSQLADYELLRRALFEVFGEGTLGQETNDIYREYIGSSATCGCLSQMKEKGSDIRDAAFAALAFMVNEDFVIR